MSFAQTSYPYKLFLNTVRSSQSILLTLSVHMLALLFGMWPLFNMVVWSFFYTTFYGSSAQAFLAVTFFLCFQGVLHSILEGLYKTAAHLLAIFHAQSLRSSLLKQLTDVIPSQKVMIELEQSLSDCENFFVSFYHISTGILFQTGNVFGNFLNLYHCALLPAGLSFYGAVFIIDVIFYYAANNKSPLSLESLSLKQKNDKTTLRRQIGHLRGQAPFLEATPSKRTWACASVDVLNQAYVRVCALRYAVKDVLAMIQNFINEAMYPMISILLIFWYKIPFPLTFDQKFPLRVVSIGRFVQILESFAQIFRNGSFLRKNLNHIVTHRTAASNLHNLTASWPETVDSCTKPSSLPFLVRVPLLLLRNAVITMALYTLMAQFISFAIVSSVSLPYLPLYSASTYLWPLVALQVSLICVFALTTLSLLKSRSASLHRNLLKFLLFQEWDTTLFSVLSACYTAFFTHLFISSIPAANMLGVMLLGTELFTLISSCIAYLFSTPSAKNQAPFSNTLTVPTSTEKNHASITLRKLTSNFKHGGTVYKKSLVPKHNQPLSFSFGQSYLIQGHSGIGKSSLLIPALADQKNLPPGLDVEVTQPTCHKIVFCQKCYPLANLYTALGSVLPMLDQKGDPYHNTPLKQYFYSFLINNPAVLSAEDHTLLAHWPTHRSHLMQFASHPNLGLNATILSGLEGNECLPNLSSKDQVIISCAVLYAVLFIHSVCPSYPNIMILLDEGLDCLSDQEKLAVLTQLRSATNSSAGRCVFLCVMHKLKLSMQTSTFDNLVEIEKNQLDPNVICAKISPTS